MKARDVILNSLQGEQVPYTPIWIMRQAGRYLPEYRDLRAKAKTFTNLYQTPEMASEVTLMPIKRFPLDAAIVFSDILIVLDAINLQVSFVTGEGPIIGNPIRTDKDIANLATTTDLDNYRYLADTLKICRSELSEQALIGFIGSPWTLAAYAVEGGSGASSATKNFTNLRKMTYQQPQLMHKLLKRLSDEVIELAMMQIDSGANVIQIFDSWAGLLNHDYYRNFSYAYIKLIVETLKERRPDTPCIVFAKCTPFSPQEMAECKPNAIGIDWLVDLATAFNQVGATTTIQGNLDPAALYADIPILDEEINKIMTARRNNANVRHIFNLGHGIYPDIEPDKVAYLVDAVHNYSSS